MAVTLTINGQSIQATDGRSLFDYAEALGIDVPTSCRKQGKCKECMVEVVGRCTRHIWLYRHDLHNELDHYELGQRLRRARSPPHSL